MEAGDGASAAPPATRQPPPPLTPPHLAARPADRVVRRPSPPKGGWTALMGAAINGKLDCLDHLIAMGANVNAQNEVRRRPAAAMRRGVGWG